MRYQAIAGVWEVSSVRKNWVLAAMIITSVTACSGRNWASHFPQAETSYCLFLVLYNDLFCVIQGTGIG